MKISISMIALNEEKFISRALASCTFADEIIVVDGGSDDRTLELLHLNDRVKILHHPWEGHFGDQRQFSLQHCSGDWVIRLDADEVFSRAFETQIREVLAATPATIEAIRVRQCNLVGNEKHYAKGFDNFESVPRIWRNSANVTWQGAIHETLTGFSGQISNWDSYVVHYGFLDKRRFMQKGQKYAKVDGSLVARPEDLVFRHYDIQPVPEGAEVSPLVGPFLSNTRQPAKPRIAIVRGPHLDLSEMNCYKPLSDLFDLTVYTTCHPVPPELKDAGIDIFTLPSDPEVRTAMSGLEYALFDADIVYTSQIVWPYSYQAVMVKKKFNKKAIARHTDILPFTHEGNEPLKRMKHACREAVDVFAAASNKAAKALRIEGIPRERIAVIPMGIDINSLKPDSFVRKQVRNRFGLTDQQIAFLLMPDLVADHNLQGLISADLWDKPTRAPAKVETRLLIASDAPDRAGNLRQTRQLDVDQRFIFCSGHSLFDLLNAADVFIMPTVSDDIWNEKTGMILMHVMAFGLPILAVDSEPVQDVVAEAAIMVSPHDMGTLRKTIVQVAADTDLRRVMGLKARRRAATHYSIEKSALETARLFLSVFESRHDASKSRFVFRSTKPAR